MPKIFRLIGLFILILNEVIQAAPFVGYGNEDIMVESSRLHRGAEQLRHRMNSIPDIRNIPPENFIPHYRREIAGPTSSEEEPETFVVNLKIDSEEEPETKYINLFIDTKRKY